MANKFFFFLLLWCTLGFCWTALALRCSCHVFCMCKWTKQKLIEESLGSLSCWKGMPSLMVQHFNLNHSLEEGGSCIRVTGIHSLLAPIKSIRWRREIGWSCFWYRQIGLIVPVSLSKWLPIIKENTWIFTYIPFFGIGCLNPWEYTGRCYFFLAVDTMEDVCFPL